MNLEDEKAKIDNYKEEHYFKPDEGTYNVVSLAKPKMDTFTNKEGEVSEVVELEIEVNGQDRYVWTIPRGKTRGSIWGQLVTLAVNNSSDMIGMPFSLIVKKVGDRNDYTVPEALQPVEEAVQ